MKYHNFTNSVFGLVMRGSNCVISYDTSPLLSSKLELSVNIGKSIMEATQWTYRKNAFGTNYKRMGNF